jgi:hypothetical protein
MFKLRFILHSSADSARKIGLGIQIFLILFFGAFLAGGLFFATMLGREILKAGKTRGSDRTACTIITSEPIDRNTSSKNSYGISVEYTYLYHGTVYT